MNVSAALLEAKAKKCICLAMHWLPGSPNDKIDEFVADLMQLSNEEIDEYLKKEIIPETPPPHKLPQPVQRADSTARITRRVLWR